MAGGDHARKILRTECVEGYAYNLPMTQAEGSIRRLRTELAQGTTRPSELAKSALAQSNGNDSRNTYLWQNADWTLAEAARAEAMPRASGGVFGDGRAELWGLPVSVKDCFDLTGAPTSCGVKFYRDLHGKATKDSWLVERLRAAGAVITGKTHLHPLAYGITGENPEFGECVQPRDATALTGGSSSGAVASVQEGSAVVAIGTDTGGSIRVPAVLGGLVGYRATWGRGDWRGGAHLAQSFDTMGCIFRSLEDAPLMASLFASGVGCEASLPTSFAVVDDKFPHDCDAEIVSSLRRAARALESLGLKQSLIDTECWAESFEIFAPIQAWEAARIHAGNFEHFEPSIRQRLEWGAAIDDAELRSLRKRHEEFRTRMGDLFAEHQLVLMPAAPVRRLGVGDDHSKTRARLLRYTTPFSLAGVPVVTIPCSAGGMQLAAWCGHDEALLKLAAAWAVNGMRDLSASA